MENGNYFNVSTDFSKFRVTKFTPHMFFPDTFSSCGCGQNTLALLTGIDPFKIKKQLTDKGILKNEVSHTSDAQMVKYLKQKKFRVLPITKAEMTPNRYFIASKIDSSNVILLSALFLKNEASWGILYDQTFYHNFQATQTSTLTLLNHPILTAYCLFHENWR